MEIEEKPVWHIHGKNCTQILFMMKNKINRFEIIGFSACFIVMLSTNSQTLTFADNQAREDIAEIKQELETLDNTVKEWINVDSPFIKRLGALEKIFEEFNSYRTSNEEQWRKIRTDIEKLKDKLGGKGFVEENKKWQSEVKNRLSEIDNNLTSYSRNITPPSTLTKDVGSLKEELNTYIEEMEAIGLKASNNEVEYKNIKKRLEIIEERYKKVNESSHDTYKSPEEAGDKKRGLSFIASYWPRIVGFFIFLIIIFVVAVRVIWKKKYPGGESESGNSGNVRDSNSTKKKKNDKRNQMYLNAVKPPGQNDGEAIINKEYTEENLIEWWVENGAKTFKECEYTLKKEFGTNIIIDAFEHEKNNENYWYIIGIKENRGAVWYYLFPRNGIKYENISEYLKIWDFISEPANVRYTNIDSILKPATAKQTRCDECESLEWGKIKWLYEADSVILSDKNLIEWWSKNGVKPFNECESRLKDKFGESIIVVELQDIDLITIRENNTQAKGYLLPGNIQYTQAIESYFETEGEYKLDAEIVSLEKLPGSLLTPEGRPTRWTKGKLKLREEVDKINAMPPDTTKEFTEDNLKGWWNRDKNGIKGLKDCEDSLKKEFGNDLEFINISNNPKNKDDWYVIGLKKPRESGFYYVIPRKYDFSIEIRKWFSAETETTELKKLVSSLLLPAVLDTEKSHNMPSAKGKVRLS